jgi:DNA polymerase
MTKLKKQNILNILNSYKLLGIKYIEPLKINYIYTNNIELPNEIKELEEHITHCNLCDLSKNKKNSIFSIGNNDTDIMIIGLHSNFLENNINKLLKNMIQNVLELDISKIYMTNILKCNVSNHTVDLNKPIELCIKYLIKQIELLKPKIIITTGIAFKYLMNIDEDIIDISGNTYDYNGMTVVPLLDLDFVYKNPSYKQNMYNDLKKIKLILE